MYGPAVQSDVHTSQVSISVHEQTLQVYEVTIPMPQQNVFSGAHTNAPGAPQASEWSDGAYTQYGTELDCNACQVTDEGEIAQASLESRGRSVEKTRTRDEMALIEVKLALVELGYRASESTYGEFLRAAAHVLRAELQNPNIALRFGPEDLKYLARAKEEDYRIYEENPLAYRNKVDHLNSTIDPVAYRKKKAKKDGRARRLNRIHALYSVSAEHSSSWHTA